MRDKLGQMEADVEASRRGGPEVHTRDAECVCNKLRARQEGVSDKACDRVASLVKVGEEVAQLSDHGMDGVKIEGNGERHRHGRLRRQAIREGNKMDAGM